MNRLVVWTVFVVAVLVVGTAAPLARIASDLHPMTLAFGRLGLAFIVLSLMNQNGLPRYSWASTFYSGMALAAHFVCWFVSLQHTSVVRSTLLVCSTPLWIGLWRVLSGNPVSKRFWIGVCVALVGVFLMGGGSSISTSWSLLGEGCAVLGGIMGAIYLVLSEHVRASTPNMVYAKWVCGVAAGILLIAMWFWQSDVSLLHFPRQSWWVVVGMAVGPQIMGHAGLSYCMKWIPAHLIGLSLLAEPVVAGGIAYLFLEEPIGGLEIFGGSVVLIGLFLGMRSQPSG